MAEQVVAEYKLNVDQAVKGLDKLQSETKQLDKDLDKAGKDGTKSLDNVGKEANTLSSGLKKLGGVIAAAFAVDRIVAFGKEVVMLAAKSEGVERAFARIGSPQLLQGLRDATRGTVSDLVLMQNSVKASNFKIPLENLAALFKFAQARARETGESVDYLVDSIILGIGRKSPLILDNLGISAVALREKLKGVGTETASVGDIAQAVGDIATEEMAKMGDQADTTADKIAKISTAFENIKVSFGKVLIGEIAALQENFSGLSEQVRRLTDSGEDIQGWEKIASFALRSLTFGFRIVGSIAERTLLIINGVKDGLIELGENAKIEAYRLGLSGEALKTFNALGRESQLIMIRRNGLTEDYADITADAERATEQFNKQIANQNEVILGSSGFIRSISLLNEQMKDLKTQLEAAEIGGTEFWKVVDQITGKTKELNEAIAMTNLADAFIIDEEIDPNINFKALEAYPEKVKETTDLADEMWQAHFEELMRLQDEEFANRKQKTEQAIDITKEALSSIGNFGSAISNLVNSQIQNEIVQLQKQYDQGIISREEFERKQVELQRKSAQAAKDAAIFQAVIGTAQSVINALTSPGVPYPVAAAFAGLAAATGAIQIAAIVSEPLPQFKDGGLVKEHGLLKGKSHAQGGIAVEAEGNEYFMPTKQTAKNFGLLEAMRKGIEEQYILKHYVPRMIDESLFNGINDIGSFAQLNGLTANLKDHNIIHGLDRLRQSQTYGLNMVASKLDRINNRNTRTGW